MGAATAFFWGSLVRMAVLHHATWSINSICHTFGERPFTTRDKSSNVWALAFLSMGESWHNLHHADPTAARHGVDRWQFDSSAELIRGLEKLGLAHDVRWPTPRAPRLPPRGRLLTLAPPGVPRRRHERSGAAGAAARRRARPVRRARLRRHLRRGGRGAGRREQAGRLRALRRQGGPVRRRRRPRGPGACSTSFTGALSADRPRELLEQATLALLSYVEDCSDGFRILVRESPVGQEASGGFGTIISDVAQQVEHILAETFLARGLTTTPAPLYSQALVGQVALVGQWWLDHREMGRDEVAAHLTNLAWNGLSRLEPAPVLHT